MWINLVNNYLSTLNKQKNKMLFFVGVFFNTNECFYSHSVMSNLINVAQFMYDVF